MSKIHLTRATSVCKEIFRDQTVIDLNLFVDMRDYLIRQQREGSRLKSLPILARRWLTLRTVAIPHLKGDQS